MSLYGDYLDSQGEQAPFDITHGYSKDKRPDLKQFVLSLLCVDGNVPILGKLEDGNASDKTINHSLLGAIGGHMHQHGVAEDAFIYIADSAMVTEAKLTQIGERTRYITRLPATYNEHERGILEAIAADDWQEVGRITQTAPTKNRPGASYRVHEGSVILHGKAYRVACGAFQRPHTPSWWHGRWCRGNSANHMGRTVHNTAHFFGDSVNATASACPGRGQPCPGAETEVRRDAGHREHAEGLVVAHAHDHVQYLLVLRTVDHFGIDSPDRPRWIAGRQGRNRKNPARPSPTVIPTGAMTKTATVATVTGPIASRLSAPCHELLRSYRETN